jgi:N-acetyl-gamma-glutamyl-phosphate reductase
MKTVAIAGASGYVGGELLRLVAAHPQLKLVAATANSNAGTTVGSIHPHLVEYSELVLKETSADNLVEADIVFLALPHTTSAEVASWLRPEQLVLDCGADFRLESAEAWAKFYGTDHPGTWVYGMPELVLSDGTKQREKLRDAKRIAVPGCNVTAITLALAPLANAGLIELDDIVSVLSVGTSGAGRALKANLLASEVSGSASAYGVGGIHRHTPEIEQNLGKAAGAEVKISFTPVLVPMSRGILAVNTATLKTKGAREALLKAYSGETFVRVLPEGEYPATSSTLGVNTCLIGVAEDAHANRVVVVSAIDNLVKGTAGAAIQSLNLAIGLPEETGLSVNGVAP